MSLDVVVDDKDKLAWVELKPHPGLTFNDLLIFSQFRIFVPKGAEKPRLYKLYNQPVQRKTVNGVVFLGYPNLSMEYCGEVSVKRFRELLLDTPSNAADLHTMWQMLKTTATKNKEKFPDFDTWLGMIYAEIISLAYFNLPVEPLDFSKDPAVYCLGFFDEAKICPGPYPSWENFMSQMDPIARPVYAAFIYAAFDENNEGRQMLYLFDEGGTGKSSVAQAIFDNASCAAQSINKDVLDSRFGYSTILGKRLLVFADSKNPNVLKYTKLHNITGGDLVPIEFKGITTFTRKLYARIIINSNVNPDIDPYKVSEKSRTIPIKLDPKKCADKSTHYDKNNKFVGDPTFRKRLTAEFWHFMDYARTSYHELCPTGQELLVPEELYENIESATTDFFEFYVENNLLITQDEDDFIFSEDVKKSIESEVRGGVSSLIVKDFKIYLETLGVLRARRIKDGGRRTIYIGVKWKNGNMAMHLPQMPTCSTTSDSDELFSEMRF